MLSEVESTIDKVRDVICDFITSMRPCMNFSINRAIEGAAWTVGVLFALTTIHKAAEVFRGIMGSG